MFIIDNQNWQNIQNSEQAQRRDDKRSHNKEGTARVAEENCSTKSLGKLQQVTKDVVLASESEGAAALFTVANKAAAKPQLPNPQSNWNGCQDLDDSQMSLIAIIGAVLCIQAKANSRFWSSQWKEATSCMMAQVKFAPLIGDAIKGAYTAQSNATLEQAAMSKTDGIINLCMFGGAVALSGFSEFTGSEEENPLNADKNDISFAKQPNVAEEETSNLANESKALNQEDNVEGEGENQAKNANQSAGKVNEELAEKADKEAQEGGYFEGRADKDWQGFKRGMGIVGKRANKWMNEAFQKAQGMQLMSAGVTGLNDSKYQTNMAAYQKQEGGDKAIESEGNSYQQFYSQAFSRAEDLRQSAGQNLEYALQILKSASDSITQVVSRMFQS